LEKIIIIRLEEDFCDQELISLHLSFTIKNFLKNLFFWVHFPHFIGFMDKGEKQMLLKATLGVMLNYFFG
jgi:hypothetical protein